MTKTLIEIVLCTFLIVCGYAAAFGVGMWLYRFATTLIQ
jgi:hypothetical protein